MALINYESNEALSQYLAFHYPDLSDYCPWEGAPRQAIGFAQKVADFALAHCLDHTQTLKALDMGCAVGGTTFELTKKIPRVLGIDLSEKFISAAQHLKSHRKLNYPLLVEGCRTIIKTAALGCHVRPEAAEFRTGDATSPDSELRGFDLLILANLLCRTPDPRVVLSHSTRLLRPGGTLVITTPGTWLEEFTPKQNWLCNAHSETFDGLKQILEPQFTLLERRDIPLLLREHGRKFQFTVADASAWRYL